jgi:general stress protein 26
MTRAELLAYLRTSKYGVISTIGPTGEPQAALVGVAFSDGLEVIFDTMASTRKAQNLARDARMALVVGGTDEQTAQIEGLADIVAGVDRERLLGVYLAAFPEGRDRLAWPGILHIRLRPTWIRHSDYRGAAPAIVEWDSRALAAAQ